MKLAYRSKKQAVYEWILTRIVAGEYAPNSILVIDDLARQLALSPIPVREALQQLESEGFVVIAPHARVMVADLKPELIIEIFSLLEAVELASCRLACVNLQPEGLKELHSILDLMDHKLADADEWSALNARFHLRICELAGARLLVSTLSKSLRHWDRLRRHFLPDVFGRRLSDAQDEHWKIWQALQDRDLISLEIVVRQHSRLALASYINYLDIPLHQYFPTEHFSLSS